MEEQLVNWPEFLRLLPFMLAGIAVHILDKISSARRRPGYSLARFMQENTVGYIAALIVCLTGTALIAGPIDVIPGVAKVAVAFAIGTGGGSIIRSWITKLQKK